MTKLTDNGVLTPHNVPADYTVIEQVFGEKLLNVTEINIPLGLVTMYKMKPDGGVEHSGGNAHTETKRAERIDVDVVFRTITIKFKEV